MPRICSLAWCDRPHYALGYCHTHYVRHRRGLPLEPPIKPHRKRPSPAPPATRTAAATSASTAPTTPTPTAWAGSTSTSWS